MAPQPARQQTAKIYSLLPEPRFVDAGSVEASKDRSATAIDTDNATKTVKAMPEAAAEAQNSRTPENAITRILLDRAEARRRIGDILGARQFLERAAVVGSVEALARLAETYDPKKLAAWGARGVQADEAKAASLYEQAKDGQGRGSRSARAENRRD